MRMNLELSFSMAGAISFLVLSGMLVFLAASTISRSSGGAMYCDRLKWE